MGCKCVLISKERDQICQSLCCVFSKSGKITLLLQMLLLEWDLYLPGEAALERDAVRSLCYRQNNLPCWNVICCRGLFGVRINEKDKHDDCWWFSVTRLLLGIDLFPSFCVSHPLSLWMSQSTKFSKIEDWAGKSLTFVHVCIIPCIRGYTHALICTQSTCVHTQMHPVAFGFQFGQLVGQRSDTFCHSHFSSTQMWSTWDPKGTTNILAGSNLSHKIKLWNSDVVKGNSAINPVGAHSFTTCGLRLWNKSVPWL